MKKFLLLGLAAALLVGCGGTAEKAAEPIAEAPAPEPAGPLAVLEDNVGKAPGEVGLWEAEILSSRLKSLLEDDYGSFVAAMATSEPIGREGDVAFVNGQGEDGSSAVLMADLGKDSLRVYLRTAESRVVYSEKGDWTKTPADVSAFLAGGGAAAE